MKIAVLGYSGSGKSTTTKYLGEFFNIPYLYMDTVYWAENWQERDRDEALARVAAFMKQDDWVIDGNYSSLLQKERLEQADYIIFMNFSRWSCLWRVIKRYLQNHSKSRESIAEGCVEKIDAEFIWWVLYAGRTPAKKKKYREMTERYKGKVIVLKNQQQLDRFLQNVPVYIK